MYDGRIAQQILFRGFALDRYSNNESIIGIKYNEIFMVQRSEVGKGFAYINQAQRFILSFERRSIF